MASAFPLGEESPAAELGAVVDGRELRARSIWSL
jgi:hypothetical protein